MASLNGAISPGEAAEVNRGDAPTSPAVAATSGRPTRSGAPRRRRRPISPRHRELGDAAKARRALATFCKWRLAIAAGGDGETGLAVGAAAPAPAALDRRPLPALAPRVRQTLDGLLRGDSEKQIAHRLGLSKHTVHVYVKALYRRLNVSSRGELFAQFVRAG